MLGEGEVLATIAVSNIEQAKKFYGEILGLQKVSENPGRVTFVSGPSKLFLYESALAKTNKATSATWEVPDFEQVVSRLKTRGVSFETYDMPGATINEDFIEMGDMKATWFEDPDGNVLCIANAH